ncbi:MAG: hypothetical protein GXP58_08600 [Deltaproteobacteria bacterium]|nr:hypothetical protein [Deltaproteobacteria bacterium]
MNVDARLCGGTPFLPSGALGKTRPGSCPRCHSDRLWGHGFVERLFDGFSVPLLIRRYRCSLCGCIITLRPDSHFPRIQAPKEEIRSALSHRIATGR